MKPPIPPERGRFGLLASMIAAAVSGVALTTTVEAQVGETETAQQPLEEITVTGSRIRRDDFSSAQPTTVMDSDYLQNIGIINLGQAMTGVPQNVNRTSPTANAGNNFFNGSTLANLRGLNPFFGSRTLTLVDSRRHVPTNQGDGVDLNFIPTVLIDRIETVTGGASASYGSGAIGGVQNILLDRNFEGIKAEVDFGATAEGDGDSTHFGFAFGTGVGDDGHFVIGIEGEDTDGVFKCASARDWCAQSVQTLTNTSWPTDGRPQNLITPGVHQAWDSPNGLFWLPGLGGRVTNSGTIVPGVQLNVAGNGLIDFDPGVGGDAFFAGSAVGGETERSTEDTVLRSPVERNVVYLSFDSQINDNLGFFVEASYGDVETDTEGGFTSVDYTCIRSDNAFIQPEIVGNSDLLDFVTANDGAFPCFQFDPVTFAPVAWGVPFIKNWENQINHGNVTETELARVAFGFDGQFGDSTWTWDAYYQWGESDRTQLVRDLVHENRYNYAIDSVLVDGQPVCRSVADPNVTTPTAVANFLSFLGRAVANPELRIGCQPLNPFGTGPIDPAAKGYAFGFIREDTIVTQNMAEFVTSGDIAEGFGAGPLRAAFGISFRSEELQNIAAEELGDAIRRDFAIQYGETFAGDVDVIEYFGELDLPFHENFAMNIAARRSEYENTAGQGTRLPGAKYDYDIDTWKVGATWDVVPSFRIRLSESHDIRAPNHRELYYGQVFTPGSFFGFIQPPFSFNPWTNSPNADPVSAILFGGERNNVLPEESDTTTIGFVIQPQNSNIRLGLDYFEIDLEGSITPANLSITLEGCGLGIQTFCDKITDGITTLWADPAFDHFGAPTGGQDSIPCPATCYVDIESYFAETFNAGEYQVKGLDITFDWLKPLSNGSLLLRMLATRTFEQVVSIVRSPLVEIPPVDIVGTVGNTVGFLSDYASAPDVSANVTATWQRGNFSLTGQMRYIDDGIINRGRIGPEDSAFDPSLPGSVTRNEIGSYEIYTLSGTYDFDLDSGNQLQLWGVINNLTDEDPPLIGLGGFGGGVGGTNPIFYDTIGRDYRIGIRMNF